MRCTKCGTNNPDHFNFCCGCGTPLPKSTLSDRLINPPPKVPTPINAAAMACRSAWVLAGVIVFTIAVLYAWLEPVTAVPFPSPVLLLANSKYEFLYYEISSADVILDATQSEMSFFVEIGLFTKLPTIANSLLCLGIWIAYANGSCCKGDKLRTVTGLEIIKLTLTTWMIIRLIYWSLLLLYLFILKIDSYGYTVLNTPILVSIICIVFDILICKFCIGTCSNFIDIGCGILSAGPMHTFVAVLLLASGACSLLLSDGYLAMIFEGIAVLLFGGGILAYNASVNRASATY